MTDRCCILRHTAQRDRNGRRIMKANSGLASRLDVLISPVRGCIQESFCHESLGQAPLLQRCFNQVSTQTVSISPFHLPYLHNVPLSSIRQALPAGVATTDCASASSAKLYDDSATPKRWVRQA